jgi:tRNA dimethylallyltransferase
MEGIDPMPEVPESVREAIEQEYQAKGLIWLQRELQHRDPAFWQQAEQQNPRRLQRALEVLQATGKSILAFRNATPAKRSFAITPLVVTLPPEVLRKRINERVDTMMELGLLEEVKSVFDFRHLPALQTVGYRELISHLEGKCSLDESIQQIKTNTWQYARRQITWFKKQPGFLHLPANEISIKKIQSLG